MVAGWQSGDKHLRVLLVVPPVVSGVYCYDAALALVRQRYTICRSVVSTLEHTSTFACEKCSPSRVHWYLPLSEVSLSLSCLVVLRFMLFPFFSARFTLSSALIHSRCGNIDRVDLLKSIWIGLVVVAIVDLAIFVA